jgi:hypothetical protein
MKQIIKLDKGKYIHLDSYGEPPVNYMEAFLTFCMVIGITTMTVGALFGTDVTKLIQMPSHSIPQLKP